MNPTPFQEHALSVGDAFVDVLDRGADGVLVVRQDGTIMHANKQAETLLAYSAAELSVLAYEQLFTEKCQHEGMNRLHSFFRDHKTFDRYEIELATRTEVPLFAELSIFLVSFEGVIAQCVIVRDISVHKKTDAALQKDANRYRDLFDNANDLIQNLAPDGTILYVNRAWRETLGYTEQEIEHLKIFDVIDPEGRDHCLQLFQQVLQGVDLPLVTVVYRSKTGVRVVLEGDVSVRSERGNPISTRGIFRNITQRVEDERRIRELASIVDQSFEAIVITDTEGMITYVNNSWQQLTEWDAADVVGKTTPRIIKSGMQDDAFYAGLWERIKKGVVVNERLINRKKSGTFYRAEMIILPLIDPRGTITGFAGFQRDVTAHDLAEQALIGAKQYAESIIEGANAIVAVLDNKGMIEVFNKQAEHVTGYTKAELVGKNWFEVLVPRDRYPDVWTMFEQAMQHGFPKTFEHPILTKDGRELTIAWTNNDRMERGVISGVITFGVDITERKKIERELLEKNRDLEQFKRLMVGRELKMIELKKELALAKQQITGHEEKIVD